MIALGTKAVLHQTPTTPLYTSARARAHRHARYGHGHGGYEQGRGTCNRGKIVAPKMSLDVVETSYLVGKGLTLWVLFTTSLNWYHYRSIRKAAEKKNEQRDEDNKKH